MMLEIDGEFFEDPCEIIRATKTLIATTLLKVAFIQYETIMYAPLFPPKLAEGGIINSNIYKGDIVRPALWDMETEEEKNENRI